MQESLQSLCPKEIKLECPGEIYNLMSIVALCATTKIEKVPSAQKLMNQ